jgi:hypothetical protein
MGNQFASGKKTLAACDVCGFRVLLKDLKSLVVKGKKTQIMACRACWVPDQPQLMLGTFPVYDPQAVRNARPDTAYTTSGTTADGSLGGGSRVYQWGWAPVGGGDSAISDTPNPLAIEVEVGTVTVSVT